MGIEYREEPLLVRGLDYYSKTTFEFVSGELGSQDAVLAGGRYDGLVEQISGEVSKSAVKNYREGSVPEPDQYSTPAIGFSAGVERMMILRDTYRSEEIEINVDCFLAPLSEDCLLDLLPLLKKYRSLKHPVEERNLAVELGNPGQSMRSLMRRANRYNARFVLIYGDREREEKNIAIKNMITGEQQTVGFPPENLLEMLAGTYKGE
ncbi:MAG: His/Gly/Thr/Pro-type tRNA ligase C-terminal domain-containing protein, partial [bacterium]